MVGIAVPILVVPLFLFRSLPCRLRPDARAAGHTVSEREIEALAPHGRVAAFVLETLMRGEFLLDGHRSAPLGTSLLAPFRRHGRQPG